MQSDIIQSLKLKDPYLAVGSFDRKNLFYGVKTSNHGSSSVFEFVEEILKCVASSGSIIIYCTSIKDVEQVIFVITSFKKNLMSLTFMHVIGEHAMSRN